MRIKALIKETMQIRTVLKIAKKKSQVQCTLDRHTFPFQRKMISCELCVIWVYI